MSLSASFLNHSRCTAGHATFAMRCSPRLVVLRGNMLNDFRSNRSKQLGDCPPCRGSKRVDAANVETIIEEASYPASSTGDNTFNWYTQWYPIFFVRDLKDKEPNTFTLLNLPLVVWRDSSGEWRTFVDACPHRLVPLSEGRITAEGMLECPYHGWQFSGGGRCEAIPEGGDPSDPRTRAIAFPTVIVQGMLWVKPLPISGGHNGAEATPQLPLQEEIEDPSYLPPIDVFRDMPYDYATLLENVLDVGHVPYTHHGTVSRRSAVSVYDLSVTERTPTGFSGVWQTGPRMGKWGSQYTSFVAPCFMRHGFDDYEGSGLAGVTSVYAIPISPGKSRAMVRNQLKFKSPLPQLLFSVMPDFMSHTGNHTVLEDDVIFLHKQEPIAVEAGMGEKPIGQVYRMTGASDAFVAAFRRWLDKEAGGGPFGPMNSDWLKAHGMPLDRDALLDRYNSHTINCKICSGALSTTRKLLAVCRVLVRACAVLCAGLGSAWLAGSGGAAASSVREMMTCLKEAAGRPAAVLCVISLISCLVFQLVVGRLSKLESSLLRGQYPPPRNTAK